MLMVDFCSRNCNHFTSEFCQVRKVSLSKYDKNSISGSTLCPYNQTAFLVNAESKLMWRLSTLCGSIISNRLWSVTNFYISALPYPVNKQDIMYDCCPFLSFCLAFRIFLGGTHGYIWHSTREFSSKNFQ